MAGMKPKAKTPKHYCSTHNVAFYSRAAYAIHLATQHKKNKNR